MASPASSATSSPSGSSHPGSPIENEIPTYRAVSPTAVASLGLGVLSALSFTSLFWTSTAVLAVVFGVVSLRSLKRFPDVLTGRSFAQAGIAMGLVFGVTSVAYVVVSLVILYSDARTFARQFNETLVETQMRKPLETSDVVWYMIPSSMRRGITPEDAKAQLSSMMKNSEKVAHIDGSLRAMIGHAKDDPIEFVSVESAEFIDLNAYASVLFRVGSPAKAEHEHKEGETHDPEREKGIGYALVLFKGTGPRNSPNRWHVDDIRYPYEPNSYVAPIAPPPDDGHGHGG